jgi:uncharacterized repeat protein (TIGR03803 family)
MRTMFAWFVLSNLFLLALPANSATLRPEALGQGPMLARPDTVKFKILHSFTGSPDGRYPQARIMRDGAGNLWGTTYRGGGPCGCGIVYELTPQGATFRESVIYTFQGQTDGKNPVARLFLSKSGTFYGTTELGGPWGFGTVFQMVPQPSGSYSTSVIHDFTGTGDGAAPEAALIGNPAGQLFGTTGSGGEAYCGCGTVFELTPGQNYSLLYSFQGAADGSTPSAPLVMDPQGALYGTTEAGGTSNDSCHYGCGTVFRLTGAGNVWHKTILYKFQGYSDGADPTNGLLFEKGGTIYGTTRRGGTGCNGAGCGTVFKLTPSGNRYTESVIYRFAERNDGVHPESNLVENKKGVLYGTTSDSHGLTFCGCGTVFSLSKVGASYQETVLHAFEGWPDDGSTPTAGLVYYDAQNILYGTTYAGGSRKYGTAFAIAL